MYGSTGIGAFSSIGSEAAVSSIKKQSETDNLKNLIESAKDDKALMTACQSFESYFLQMMFKSMRNASGISNDGFIKKSFAENIFQDMLDEENCKNIAGGQGIGLAKMLYNQLKTKD